MRAVVAAADGFSFADLDAPSRHAADDVLIDVEWVSLNGGEPGYPWERGSAVGWDAFGHVAETSADGQGPPVGTRVVTWSFAGAWAEQRVVGRHDLALVPDSVPDQAAAALPVAGLTALQAVARADARAGTRIAVTGASGGVGHLATQLARRAGAQVVAVVRDLSRATWLDALHDDEYRVLAATDTDQIGTIDAVIDNVGGAVLSSLSPSVRAGGRLVLVGVASGNGARLDTGDLIGRRIDVLTIQDPRPAGEGLARLLALVAQGDLRISVAEGGDWSALVPRLPRRREASAKTVYRVGRG